MKLSRSSNPRRSCGSGGAALRLIRGLVVAVPVALLLGDRGLDRLEAELRTRHRLPLHGDGTAEALFDREQHAVASEDQRPSVGGLRQLRASLGKRALHLGPLLAVQVASLVDLGLEV